MTKDEALEMAIDELMGALRLLQRFEPQIVGGDMTAWTVGLRNQLSDLQHTLYNNGLIEAIKACKEALATNKESLTVQPTIKESLNVEQPAQDPDYWIEWIPENGGRWEIHTKKPNNMNQDIIELYTHPAPSWQGLSDEEVNDIYPCAEGVHDFRDIVRAIEQALKEKNHG